MLRVSIKKNRAFTLIELLVVISIIGILVGIIVTTLTTARDRAKDIRIIAAISQVRGAAELYATGNNNNYLGFDGTDTENTLAADINNMYGGAGTSYTLLINNDGSGYCATAILNSGDIWCVDSGFKSEQDEDRILTNCVSGCVTGGGGGGNCRCDD